MKSRFKKIAIKAAKVLAISFGGILGVMLVLPMLFPEKITQEVKTFANQKLNGELNFKEANLSFFNHFPSLTLTLKGFSLKGSAPYQHENLVSSDEISFGIHLGALIFENVTKINQIYLSDAQVNVLVNEKGEANYNVYVSDAKASEQSESATSLYLEKIDIANAHLTYTDQSAKIQVNAKGFNYLGKGDLHQSIFNLFTKAHIDSFDFSLDGEAYLKDKKVDADLITKVNTNSLSFVFEHNNLLINRLPVDFKGAFDFLKNGYRLDFNIQSEDSKLGDVFTAFPPQYVKWLEKTDIKGNTDLQLTLKGKYIVSENAKPDLAFNIKVRNGFVAYDKSPYPASNIFLNLDAQLPSLNTENVKVKIDSLFFNIGKDYFKGIISLSGLQKPDIEAIILSKLDLGKLHRALGISDFDFKGVLTADVKAKGKFDPIAKLFPVIKGNIVLKSAAIKTPYYPNAIENINLVADVRNQSGNYKDLYVKVAPGSFRFEGKPFQVNASFQNFEDIAYDIQATGELDVAKVYKVFSKQGLDLEGYIKADLSLKGTQSDATQGRYNKLENKGTLVLRNIKTSSEYLPMPFIIKDGLFKFNQNQLDFSNFMATYGQSDFRMNGQMQNVINYVLSDGAILKGRFSIESKYLDIDEFMSVKATQPNDSSKLPQQIATQKGVIIIPPNVDFNLEASAKKVAFQGLDIQQVRGNLMVNKGKLALKDAGFTLIGATVAMNATYSSFSAQKALFDYDIKADDFDIKRAYKEVKMFRDMATSAEKAEGIVSLDYKIAGKIDQNMQPIYPSLVGGGVLRVKDVKMNGFKLFNAVSKKTNKEGIENPNVKQVEIKTKVKNNLITIERFKFKVAGFRPRIEGTTSLDGRLNIKMRLGLPPLGIIGIPMVITGTQNNPKVKLGKGEDIEETKEEEVEEKH